MAKDQNPNTEAKKFDVVSHSLSSVPARFSQLFIPVNGEFKVVDVQASQAMSEFFVYENEDPNTLFVRLISGDSANPGMIQFFDQEMKLTKTVLQEDIQFDRFIRLPNNQYLSVKFLTAEANPPDFFRTTLYDSQFNLITTNVLDFLIRDMTPFNENKVFFGICEMLQEASKPFKLGEKMYLLPANQIKHLIRSQSPRKFLNQYAIKISYPAFRGGYYTIPSPNFLIGTVQDNNVTTAFKIKKGELEYFHTQTLYGPNYIEEVSTISPGVFGVLTRGNKSCDYTLKLFRLDEFEGFKDDAFLELVLDSTSWCEVRKNKNMPTRPFTLLNDGKTIVIPMSSIGRDNPPREFFTFVDVEMRESYQQNSEEFNYSRGYEVTSRGDILVYQSDKSLMQRVRLTSVDRHLNLESYINNNFPFPKVITRLILDYNKNIFFFGTTRLQPFPWEIISPQKKLAPLPYQDLKTFSNENTGDDFLGLTVVGHDAKSEIIELRQAGATRKTFNIADDHIQSSHCSAIHFTQNYSQMNRLPSGEVIFSDFNRSAIWEPRSNDVVEGNWNVLPYLGVTYDLNSTHYLIAYSKSNETKKEWDTLAIIPKENITSLIWLNRMPAEVEESALGIRNLYVPADLQGNKMAVTKPNHVAFGRVHPSHTELRVYYFNQRFLQWQKPLISKKIPGALLKIEQVSPAVCYAVSKLSEDQKHMGLNIMRCEFPSGNKMHSTSFELDLPRDALDFSNSSHQKTLALIGDRTLILNAGIVALIDIAAKFAFIYPINHFSGTFFISSLEDLFLITEKGYHMMPAGQFISGMDASGDLDALTEILKKLEWKNEYRCQRYFNINVIPLILSYGIFRRVNGAAVEETPAPNKALTSNMSPVK